MKQLALLWLTLCIGLAPACAQIPRGDFQPTQLRDFRRDSLVIQRSGGRDQFSIWVAETSAQHQQAVDGLFSLVLEFLDVRNDRRGLARMYTQHEAMYADIDG